MRVYGLSKREGEVPDTSCRDVERRERAYALAQESRRLVLISRNYREAENFSIAHRLSPRQVSVICDERGLFNLRAHRADTARVITLGYWQDGFHESQRVEHELKVRGMTAEHIQDW